ncbi:Sec8 exocyst complex component-specific domain-containing protein [Epithele typhae]|uniref:Sec8 exocyst complex component-specific domain-containing protein n=1 Tax=Epithele typhae TaxID=378194 RepID=UPI002007428A|nr:Sec8 exocyst complex component-specific domain-containing protein [Epithele typhae]KAH9944194.1 Sec8 exocyst complex component-specific domain-containing protein [Epithele typhae]
MESRTTRDSQEGYDGRPSGLPNGPQSRSRITTNGSEQANGRRYRDPVSPAEISPTSLAAVAAFQSFGRRRGTIDDADDEYEIQRQREIEVQKQRQQKIREKVPGRRTTGKAKAGDIDAVLDEIRDEWAIVTGDDFNPVDLALQLLDESSLGKDMDSFRRTKAILSRAMKGSIDKHYQAFNAALPHHSALLNHLDATQKQIVEARNALQEAKETLGSKRGDLVQLWSRNQTVEEMMRILDQIEHLKSVPDALESLILEKRLLQAAGLLVRSLKLIKKPDMMEIGAVSDLRSYLVGQEATLREILVDELHGHLYLKSFWCESRWAMYAPNQQTFSDLEDQQDEPEGNGTGRPLSASSPVSPNAPRPRASRLAKFLDDLALRPNDPPFDVNDTGYRKSVASGGFSFGLSSSHGLGGHSTTSNTTPRNPEADSFAYIETLLEALAVLGKLGTGLDIVAQKLPTEVFSLVEATVEEVSERAEYGRRGSMVGMMDPVPSDRLGASFLSTPIITSNTFGIAGVAIVSTLQGTGMNARKGVLDATSLRLTALEASTKVIDQETLRDFFWTLYSKLIAVSEGLRVVFEVANRIGSRRDYKDSSGTKLGSLFPLEEVWAPIQAEIRVLLSDYVTDEEQGAVSGRNPISSINEILRDGRFIRDKMKPIFRFADSDAKSATKTLRQSEDELTRVLKDTVPGLVQSSENAVQSTLAAVGTDDRLMGTGQHHRLLVHPNAFHITILFQPTLAWLDRIADILPSGLDSARKASAVLDEFVLKVYLPQLEDKVSTIFHQTITSPDAFEPDPASLVLSSRPLAKASVQLMALINSLCSMLRTTPFHRENYSRLILTVIGKFYQRCSDRFSHLVSVKGATSAGSDESMATAAQWAQKPELGPCLTELLKVLSGSPSVAPKSQLCRQETHLESSLLGEGAVSKDDLVPSVRNVSALASLYHSVTWFAHQLNALKMSPEEVLPPNSPLHLEPPSAVTPLTPYPPLAELILYTIRIDVRCRAIHHLDLALRHGNYRIEHEAGEPDPHVVDLNTEMGNLDACLNAALPDVERKFVFEGISHLMQYLLIANARFIPAANEWGIKKMNRNMLALRQNIKSLADDSDSPHFERAKRYYSLFLMTPSEMLDTVRQKQEFSFDEYKVILDLQCGVERNAADGGSQATDRNYNMYLIELHGLELESSSDVS